MLSPWREVDNRRKMPIGVKGAATAVIVAVTTVAVVVAVAVVAEASSLSFTRIGEVIEISSGVEE